MQAKMFLCAARNSLWVSHVNCLLGCLFRQTIVPFGGFFLFYTSEWILSDKMKGGTWARKY